MQHSPPSHCTQYVVLYHQTSLDAVDKWLSQTLTDFIKVATDGDKMLGCESNNDLTSIEQGGV